MQVMRKEAWSEEGGLASRELHLVAGVSGEARCRHGRALLGPDGRVKVVPLSFRHVAANLRAEP